MRRSGRPLCPLLPSGSRETGIKSRSSPSGPGNPSLYILRSGLE